MRLRKPDFYAMKLSFTDIFNTKDEDAKGRTINLISVLLASFYNVFITGIFYTGFLSMYGISITGVGIITFIPQIASCFSIFSSQVLSHFKKRKTVLVISKIFFYTMYIIATTLMPQFVHDPGMRLVWFGIILFIGYSVYALFSPGFTMWFYHFYPKDNERRTRYLVYTQIFSSVMSSIILMFSGVLTDAVAGSPWQDQLILILRYVAFGLVVIETLIQARAIEYPEPPAKGFRFHHIFTLPFKYRKFILCMAFMFAWNYIANINNGLWPYHLLNHLHYPYTLINAMSVMYTIILVCTSTMWKKVLYRYSWIKTFGLCLLIFVPTEPLCFLIGENTIGLYVFVCIWQNILNVGVNFAWANVLYMNLPEDNPTAHIAFNAIGSNVFAFLGLMTGTYISSLSGDTTFAFMGMQVYSVQFNCLLRGLLLLIMGIVLVRHWRAFTRDDDIAIVEEMDVISRKKREYIREQVKLRLTLAKNKHR